MGGSWSSDGGDIGGIQNTDRQPQPGDRVKVCEQLLEIIEIVELMPPRGDFAYLHATCSLVKE